MFEITLSPWPLVIIAIEPKWKADREKLGLALSKLANEDPTFRVSANDESGQTILESMSELHLETKIARLRSDHDIAFDVGAPQVAYRETLTKKVDIDYTHKKRAGGTDQFARVKLVIEPSEVGKGFEFESKVVGGAVPKEYILGAETGLNSVIGSGVLAGFPVVGIKVSLIDVAFHEVDSSALAFEIASRAGLREGLQKAGSVLLEPIMKVEVMTPEDYTGSVIGDLNSRRGQIQSQDMRGKTVSVRAVVPLASMFGYANTLARETQGRANWNMQYLQYERVLPAPGSTDPTLPPAAAAALVA